MKSHQPIFSYSSRRRSEQLVRICQMRSAKKATSSGGMPCSGPNNDPRSLTSVNSSGTVDGVVVGSFKRAAAEAREDGAGGIDQILRDRAGASIRSPRHGVDDVLVEPWEEAEAMLAREVSPRRGGKSAEVDRANVLAGSRAGDDDAAGLATRHVAQLEDANGEAALAQLVRGAQAADAAAKHDHRLGHRQLLPLNGPRTCRRCRNIQVSRASPTPRQWRRLSHRYFGSAVSRRIASAPAARRATP